MNLAFCHWKNFGIGARLMVITALPVVLLFSFVLVHSFHSRLAEAQEELEEKGRLTSSALAESSEYPLISGNFADLETTMSGLMRADRSISSIAIQDAARRDLFHTRTVAPSDAQTLTVEAPIHRKSVAIDAFDEQGLPHVSSPGNEARPTGNGETVGYVRVTLSTGAMFAKQTHRFLVQSAMALVALIVSFLLALLLTRHLTRPLAACIDAVRRIRSGEKSIRVEVSTGGEIGDLQASINEMAESLGQSQQELENRVDERTKDLQASRNEALKANEEKRKLIQKVNSVVEDERKSIANEIHDELNATVIAVRLTADRILNLAVQADQNPVIEEIKDKAREVSQLAVALYASGRHLVRRLRPEVLDMLGLQGAVEEMVRQYDRAHPDCRFILETSGDFSGLESEIAITAYRLIQESLFNVVKHAQASTVRILLVLDEAERILHISIVDNGAGFDAAAGSQGIGIIGMRERVFALSGQLTIHSEPGRGTSVAISLPYH